MGVDLRSSSWGCRAPQVTGTICAPQTGRFAVCRDPACGAKSARTFGARARLRDPNSESVSRARRDAPRHLRSWAYLAWRWPFGGLGAGRFDRFADSGLDSLVDDPLEQQVVVGRRGPLVLSLNAAAGDRHGKLSSEAEWRVAVRLARTDARTTTTMNATAERRLLSE